MSTGQHLNNTNLYNFNFSDRTDESAKLKNFMLENNESILLVKGESGVGKSFFLDESLKLTPKYCVVKEKIDKGAKTGNCIANIIKRLQTISNKSLWDFVNKHYKGLKLLASDVSKFLNLTESNYLKYMFSKNCYIVDADNKPNNLANILKKYLENNFNETPIVFVIDNFNRCDRNSLETLIDLAKSSTEYKYMRFIFVVTDKKSTKTFISYLYENIPCENMDIPQIPTVSDFIKMLPTEFNIDNLKNEDRNKIYDFCEGKPEKLKDLLSNLYSKRGIHFYENTMTFDRDILLEHMVSESNELNINKFSFGQKCILLVIICIGKPVSVNLLRKLTKYLYKELFVVDMTNKDMKKAFKKLQKRLLNITFDGQRSSIYIDHDLTYDAVMSYFKKENLYATACDFLYDYWNMNKNVFDNYYGEIESMELLAELSYNAENSYWFDENYSCSKYFYNNRNYQKAINYFNRIFDEPSLDKSNLDNEWLLEAGITSYEVGEYSRALEFLKLINRDTISRKYEYFIYIGKSYNMCNLFNDAIISFDNAASIANSDIDKRTYALYMKHLVLTQMPEKWDEAKKLYCSMAENIMKSEKNGDDNKLYIMSNAKLLKCCYNFYFNNNALSLFKLAEKIALRFDEPIELAYIYNNIGFEYVRQNDLPSAKDYFVKSRDILLASKTHEAAYPMNNLGVCYMFKNNYREAIKFFEKALLHHKSFYLSLTSNTMLMSCYQQINNPEYNRIKKNLSELIEKNKFKDKAIIRKLCMNLMICEWKDGNNISACSYLKKMIDDVENTSSEYRAYFYYNKLFNDKNMQKNDYIFKQSEYFNKLEFEPWLITLSHD